MARVITLVVSRGTGFLCLFRFQQGGFSLMEVMVGASLLLSAGYSFHHMTVSDNKFSMKYEVSSDIRSSLRTILEEVSVRGNFFVPLSDKIDNKFPLYFTCSKFVSKKYKTTSQKRAEANQAANQNNQGNNPPANPPPQQAPNQAGNQNNQQEEFSIKRRENVLGEIDYAIVTDASYSFTDSGCKQKFKNMYTKTTFKGDSAGMLDCLKDGKVGMRGQAPFHGCGNNNVVHFVLPLVGSPRVVAWSFKLSKNGDIESAAMDWVVMSRNN